MFREARVVAGGRPRRQNDTMRERTGAGRFPGRRSTDRATEGRWEAWDFTPISLEEFVCLDGAAIYWQETKLKWGSRIRNDVFVVGRWTVPS